MNVLVRAALMVMNMIKQLENVPVLKDGTVRHVKKVS